MSTNERTVLTAEQVADWKRIAEWALVGDVAVSWISSSDSESVTSRDAFTSLCDSHEAIRAELVAERDERQAYEEFISQLDDQLGTRQPDSSSLCPRVEDAVRALLAENERLKQQIAEMQAAFVAGQACAKPRRDRGGV